MAQPRALPPRDDFEIPASGKSLQEIEQERQAQQAELELYVQPYIESNPDEGMRRIIERSGRSFDLGCTISLRQGWFGHRRMCYWRPEAPYEDDWDCAEPGNTSCYCNDDPACDPYSGNYDWENECDLPIVSNCVRIPEDLVVQFSDHEVFRDWLAYDLGYLTTTPHMCYVNRRKGAYNYCFFDPVIDFAVAHGAKVSAHALVYMQPTWATCTATTPQALSNVYLGDGVEEGYIHTAVSHYAGTLDRWIVVNEAVTDHYESLLDASFPNTPFLTLASGVTQNQTQWPLTSGVGYLLGTTFPDPQADPCHAVRGIIDGEIVTITARSGDTITVQRGASPAAHDAGTVLYTIRSVIRTYCRMGPWLESADLRLKHWPWYTLSDVLNNRQNNLADRFLIDAFIRAADADPNAKLLCVDPAVYLSSGWRTGDPVNHFFENVKAVITLLKMAFQAAGRDDVVERFGLGLQVYPAVWTFLAYDTQQQGLRMNPVMLQGFINALTQFAEITPNIAITEMDVRMGIPTSDKPEYDSITLHLGQTHEWAWEEASVATRQEWQKRVYRAIFNAALSVPELSGINLWDTADRYSWLNGIKEANWPNTPPDYTDPRASNPCILGDDASTSGQVEMYTMKPAYYGVREAIENYFGPAFEVKSPEGEVLVRLCRNGNLVVLKGEIRVVTKQFSEETGWNGIWAGIAEENSFIVEDSQGTKVAAVTPSGDLYLSGGLYPGQSGLTAPASGTAFMVKDGDEVMSMIDAQGNLKLRGGIIHKGKPYKIALQHADDLYYPW